MPGLRVEVLHWLRDTEVAFQLTPSDSLDAVWIQSTLKILGRNAKLCTQCIGQTQDRLRSQVEKLPDIEVPEELLLTNTGADLELISDKPKRALLHGLVQSKWVELQVSSYCMCQFEFFKSLVLCSRGSITHRPRWIPD